MGSLNKVIIMGRLGQDPEIRMTANGKQVANLSIATSESWLRDGKREEKTEWHKVILWEKTAELAGKYLKKGSQILIEGSIQTRSWEKDGVKHYATEIKGNSMTFVDKMDSSGAPKTQQEAPAAGSSYGPDDSDVPF